MQNIGVMVPEDNLDTLLPRILQQPAILSSNSASLEQLQGFSRQRNGELHEGLDILKKSRGGLGVELHRTGEYLDTMGCTASGWQISLPMTIMMLLGFFDLLTPKFFFTAQHLPAEPLTPSYPHHSLGFGPNINIGEINLLNKQAQEREKHPSNPMLGALQGVMPVHPTTELLLGMPGYIPMVTTIA
jgi:hypothetical protein